MSMRVICVLLLVVPRAVVSTSDEAEDTMATIQIARANAGQQIETEHTRLVNELGEVGSACPEVFSTGEGEYLRELPTVHSENGILSTTMVVRATTVNFTGIGNETPGISATTRLYNCSYGGVMLRVRRGDVLQIKLVNWLGPDDAEDEEKILRREGQAGIPYASPFYQNVGQDNVTGDFESTWGGNFVGARGVPVTNVTPETMDRPFTSPTNKMVGTGHNMLHGPNKTNIHTHGLHVSPAWGQDDVVDITVYSGQSFTYNYQLSPYHAGGSHWFHAHWHGSALLQNTQGLISGLIMEDSEGEVPDWLANMRERYVIFQEAPWNYYGTDAKMYGDDPQKGCSWNGSMGSTNEFVCALQHRTGLAASLSNDKLFKVQRHPDRGFGEGQRRPHEHFFTVNGQFQPTLAMKTGEWLRLRMIYAGHNIPLKLALQAGCEWRLIAKDGVYLNEYPRELVGKKNVWLGQGNRADMVLRCLEPGKFIIRMDNYTSNWQQTIPFVPGTSAPNVGQLIGSPNLQPFFGFDDTYNVTMMFLEVTGDKICDADAEPWPATVKPPRPRYLQDTLSVPAADLGRPDVESVPVCAEGTGGDPHNCRQPYVQKELLENEYTFASKMDYDFPYQVTFGSQGNVTYYAAPVRFIVDNQTFQPRNSTTQYQALIQIAEVHRFALHGIGQHGWHIHEMPVQFEALPCNTPEALSGPNNDTLCGGEGLEQWSGFFQVGDWHDVVLIPPSVSYTVAGSCSSPSHPCFNEVTYVRFHSDCYKGVLIIHCHVLYHEDLGMFTMVDVVGEDHTWNKNFTNDGPFKFAPKQCKADGQMCAPPVCTDPEYKYGRPGNPEAQQTPITSSDRCKTKCDCSFTKKKGSCKSSKDDGSCCMAECCNFRNHGVQR